ncbi:MAG: M14 family zinc carboxypeptidase [Ignavibacteriales bacterium]|nr:M14 family zinc carboxypeptidase [Ignavibacteriales bacterium]
MHILRILSFVAIGWSIAGAQVRITAPIERAGFSRATSFDTLQVFLKEIGATRHIQVQPLATTLKGRTLPSVSISSSAAFGDDNAKIRVLLFAQQHGDEPAGKEALTLLLAKFARGEHREWLNQLDLLIVPLMNPDGAELRQRRTSDTIDLNRNHVLLTAAETRALHDLFFTWKPEVTLDMHEYSSISRSWQDAGIEKTADVQLGMLTHPDTPPSIYELQHQHLFPYIASSMEARGFSFQEYIVGSPDTRIRHSTTEINDGRQSFGILNTMSFIQEGRRWRGNEDHLQRRAEAQLASVEAFLEYCSSNAAVIRSTVSRERSKLLTAQGEKAVLRLEHFPGSDKVAIPVFNLRANKDTVWTIAPYHDVVKPSLSVNMPRAYVVPKGLPSVLDLLRRHQIVMEEVRSEKTIEAEVYTIDSIATENIEETNVPRPFLHTKTVNVTLHAGDVMIPTNQWQSRLLAIILEPESVWGLFGYPQFTGLLRKTGTYPILRIQ